MLSGCRVCDWGTCAVYIEDCERWWLSVCRGSVAERWRLKPEVFWVQLCYTFAYCLPQWIYSCTKQIKIPCYYNCIQCMYGESFLCVFPAKCVMFSFSTHPFLIHLYCLDCQVWVTSIGLNFNFVGSTPSISLHPIHNCGHHAQNMMIFFVELLLGNLFHKVWGL